MKYFNFLCLVVALSLYTSCKKEENPNKQKAILSLLNQTNINIDTSIAPNMWVYGFRFSVKKQGTIEQLGMKLPLKGSYKVQLWDLIKNEVLKEVVLTSEINHMETFQAFTPIPVTSQMILGISIEANSFYKITKKDQSKFDFPIDNGNFNILSFNEILQSQNMVGEFPRLENLTQMSPCVDVVFVDL